MLPVAYRFTRCAPTFYIYIAETFLMLENNIVDPICLSDSFGDPLLVDFTDVCDDVYV